MPSPRQFVPAAASLCTLFLLAAAACSPRVHKKVYIELPPKSSSHDIQLFVGHSPQCPHQTVGHVRITPGHQLKGSEPIKKTEPYSEMEAKLVSEAKKMGGDAVISMQWGPSASSWAYEEIEWMSGDVIAFEESDCHQ